MHFFLTTSHINIKPNFFSSNHVKTKLGPATVSLMLSAELQRSLKDLNKFDWNIKPQGYVGRPTGSQFLIQSFAICFCTAISYTRQRFQSIALRYLNKLEISAVDFFLTAAALSFLIASTHFIPKSNLVIQFVDP